MGVETLNSAGGPEWLDLLHREADGDLTPTEAARLAALPAVAVQEQRERLDRVPAALSRRPDLPRSVAAPVAQEIAWRHQLAQQAPTLPRSVAAAVVADLRVDRALTLSPAPPRSVAAQVAADVRLAAVLQQSLVMPRSVARAVAQEVGVSRVLPPVLAGPQSVAAQVAHRIAADATPAALAPQPGAALIGSRPRNPAPLVMVVSLLLALTLLAVSSVWGNLAAGALVVQTLLAQVSPLAGAGLALVLLTSALVTWRPGPGMQRLGGAAFALSALLTLPALYGVASRGTMTFGQNVVISGPVAGNVIAVGGSVTLRASAQVKGEVVTLLGDVYRAPGAQVQGHVSALLGYAPGDREAVQVRPPQGVAAVTAAAFRPVLGWLGSAAWPRVFVALTGGALLLLFVSGLAPLLARRQRHAPVRTLALGVLALAALIGPAGGLALAGLLGPALLAAALTGVLLAVGLSVSAYDAGRAVASRVHLPVPDAVGALVGLSVVAASLSVPPLAFALALIGGTWGAGTLLLTRQVGGLDRAP
ncbi:polymer-forming cytoskeletal protein [Deinococcus taeanensis]|uniref:polymer-forming cytoskeletal protein n=1 Tax=Deinococcus taeanensis TaxID=2737050 RepID=UPI001CDCBCE6|nr:polymer-forming cytoskeletal protein [Deinococcus taeanensis]UBV42708.1 polymer-forming cytoskeletal protein [Deinococcus taeanensis]